jgi:plasmid stabilization system protein ParE
VAHLSTKRILKHLIDDLPDDATIADVQYRLYIIDAVNRGRDEIASGAGFPHEQVADEMRTKWGRAREKWSGLRPDPQISTKLSHVADAANLLEEILDAAASLSTLSERGRLVPEIGNAVTREIFVHNFRLMYEVSREHVHVVVLMYGARDFETWRQERERRWPRHGAERKCSIASFAARSNVSAVAGPLRQARIFPSVHGAARIS